eukprot:3435242-Pleurochrysis_carterae.AAC.2
MIKRSAAAPRLRLGVRHRRAGRRRRDPHRYTAMSLTAESPTAASARAARAKLEKYATSLLTSRGLAHWRA